MVDLRDYASRDAIAGSLRKKFTENESWPVDRASLAALIDLGLSDGEVAAHFSVECASVAALRRKYALER